VKHTFKPVHSFVAIAVFRPIRTLGDAFMNRRTAIPSLLLAACLVPALPANAQDASKLNDTEIAHVVVNADEIDIRYAHLALALTRNPAVREFAQTMIRDHTAVTEQASALAKKLNLTPKDNAVSQDLLKKSEALVADMRKLDGAAFDRRYAENELAYHKFVNGAVEKVFIPNAKNAELKALLQAGLKTFQAHEAHAEMMVGAVK
jgi:putative membrane protein